MTGFRLLLDDWRGYVIGYFALTAVANLYMSLYGRLRVDIKAEHVQIAAVQEQIDDTHASRPTSDDGRRRNLVRQRLANQKLAASTFDSPARSRRLVRRRAGAGLPGRRWALGLRATGLTDAAIEQPSTTARSCART